MKTPNEEKLCQCYLADQQLHRLLEKVDADVAQKTQAAGCCHCGDKLYYDSYPRKPRGGPATWDKRYSFTCATHRHRVTPPLVRFLGPKVYVTLQTRTNAQVVVSPWSDHILELYDSVLVNAAVKAACASFGKPVPAAPTAWRWRFAGFMLGIAGALGLMFRLPELHPRLARTRRFIVPAVLLIAVILTMGTWVGVTPQFRRIPQQLVLLVVIWLALAGLSRLRMPRWSLAVVTGILALGSDCLCDETGSRCRSRESHRSHRPSCHFSFCHSHGHLGDQHARINCGQPESADRCQGLLPEWDSDPNPNLATDIHGTAVAGIIRDRL